ncbi:hypothetical protein E3983_09875 [Legionella israelensis]|uniref:Uncharacterized protein n=1 Tax=Legionella israelensis TaxID=454 RepID=A0AAX1EIJ5_9GAMM|nr:hypothetical protein [Legionella israelensis]QBR84642.1 hypothetical protein E3983_09875 [Legionella israelensis]
MCKTRKKLTLSSGDQFFFCGCPGTRFSPVESNKIISIEITPKALQLLQAEGGVKDYVVISRNPYECYEIYHASESPIDEKTPLLAQKMHAIKSCTSSPGVKKSIFQPAEPFQKPSAAKEDEVQLKY